MRRGNDLNESEPDAQHDLIVISEMSSAAVAVFPRDCIVTPDLTDRRTGALEFFVWMIGNCVNKKKPVFIKLCRAHVQVRTCGNQSQLFFHRLIALKRANSSDAFFRVTAYSVLLSFRQADTLVFLQSNVTDASSVPADINGIFSDISIAVDFGKCVPKDIQKTDVVCVLYGRTRQTSAGKHGFHKIRLLG